jgi:hypothetical protein
MDSVLDEFQPEEYRESEAVRLLRPLTYGKHVLLAVSDPKILHKQRIGRLVLYIGPVRNGRKTVWAVGLSGHHFEFVPKHGYKPIHFRRVGLSIHTAKVLCAALDELFGIQREVKDA